MPKTKRSSKKAVSCRRRRFSRAFQKVYWPYFPLLLTIGILLTFGSQNGTLWAAARHPVARVLAYATQMSVSGLLNDTNVARANNGAAALQLNSKLDAAAQAKANDMASRNYWSHNTPDGNPPWVFVNERGYSYQKLGENLAEGYSDEQATIDGWMASPGHRENMLDSAFSDVGFGYANNPDYTAAGGGPETIVVAFYGEPPQPAPAANPAPATPTSQPPANTPQVKNTNVAQSTLAAPAPASSNSQPSPKTPAKNAAKPVTTQTSTANAKSTPTSGARLAFSRLPAAGLIAGIVGIGAFLAAGIWAGRHARLIYRTWRRGERYVFTHPLFDLGLAAIAVLSFLLSKSAGFTL